MDRKEQAIHLHKHGFNCAQSVVCSFCNVMGADPVEAFRMSEALGFGMGTMGTCGAVSAMAIVAGLKISDGDELVFQSPAPIIIIYAVNKI